MTAKWNLVGHYFMGGHQLILPKGNQPYMVNELVTLLGDMVIETKENDHMGNILIISPLYEWDQVKAAWTEFVEKNNLSAKYLLTDMGNVTHTMLIEAKTE